jgi:16S rRNA (guanine527-N7)-methyltransferase
MFHGKHSPAGPVAGHYNPLMGAELPEIGREEFGARLAACAPGLATTALADRLHRHYQELRKWNRRLSLVGPGSAHEIVERHYGESLAGAPLLPTGARVADLGSGAGFPGLVLAAARPDAAITLIEARERKWAFLSTAAQRCALACQCLNARVDSALPEAFPQQVEAITMRALRLPEDSLSAVAARLSAAGRLLVWSGERPLPPAGFVAEREVPLGGRGRCIAVYRRVSAAGRPQ